MVETTVINSIIRWLQYWDDRSKLLLINKISNTILNDQKKKEEAFFSCFGAYESEESAEELTQSIRASRTFRERNIEL
ncbi:MAG: hypothetical protein AAGG68_01135 [Bacteroidota bacterium]